jgi:hypothetical protein
VSPAMWLVSALPGGRRCSLPTKNDLSGKTLSQMMVRQQRR